MGHHVPPEYAARVSAVRDSPKGCVDDVWRISASNRPVQLPGISSTIPIASAAVTLTSARKFSAGGRAACFVDPANYKMGLAMYASYFCLFGVLFWNKYVVKHTATRVSGPNPKEATTLCGVDFRNGDITGRFNQAIARNNSIGDLKQSSIDSNTRNKKTK